MRWNDRHAQNIATLGHLCGVSPGYWDNLGNRHETSLDTYQAFLSSMGVPWAEPERLEEEIRRRRRQPWERLVQPVTVVHKNSARGRLVVTLASDTPGLPSNWQIQGEIQNRNGETLIWENRTEGTAVLAVRPRGRGFRSRLALPLPAGLEWGYYDLKLQVRGTGPEETGATLLIVAPDRAYLPPCLAGGERLWGLNLPLYALRRPGNWGLGDFTDLKETMSWAGELGAAFVGVNPLHPLMPEAPADPSPYSPATRRFTNFLYLDLERVPELAHCPTAQAFLASPAFEAAKARLQAADLIDYAEIYRLKRQVLPWLYETFLNQHGGPERPLTPRGEELARFVKSGGDSLRKFAHFLALAKYWGKGDWRRWPAPYQQPDSPAVADFVREHRQKVGLHLYEQWLASSQLADVQDQARQKELPFTLYQDLALGTAPGGFDTWANPGLFALGAAIGAPPDAFNPRGQNWGLPPIIPQQFRESAYRLFIETLRANCPPGGMLRLDHIMGLFRLFWIPAGQEGSAGTYVYYPARDLLSILALESQRNRTLIIGEDLGTVAPHVRRQLARTGIFSYRVFYFERDRNQHFLPPENYPRQALATVTTHDLPTLAGFWEGRDIALKERLHLYAHDRDAAADRAARDQDKKMLAATLSQRGLLPPSFLAEEALSRPCPQEVRFGVLEYLSQSEAALLELRLEEMLGLTEPQNLPGTTKEHPNWRRKFPLTLSQLRQHTGITDLTAQLNRYRGREEKK
ncbi:MAG: 4-alpha-glucanotransferase [Thermodesulfobacteriota bacterium]